MKIYGIYEKDEYEECVYVGTIKEISIFLKRPTNSILSSISRRGGKYKIIPLYRERREDEI